MKCVDLVSRCRKSCTLIPAFLQALIELQAEGITRSTKIPGVHDPLDPEFTILKQRLARRIRYDDDVQQYFCCCCCCWQPF
jgi:hypothetical protein